MSPDRRIFFFSPHCYADPASGAAVATRDLLVALAGRGWDCRVLSGIVLDGGRAASLREMLELQQIQFDLDRYNEPGMPFTLVRYRQGAMPATICHTPTLHHPLTKAEGTPLLRCANWALENWQPGIVLTYGGDWVTSALVQRARARGAKVVFMLHNDCYDSAAILHQADAIVVPSRFLRDYYEQKLGVQSIVLPCPIDWSRVQCEPDSRTSERAKYLTFINPLPEKGVYWYAGIVRSLLQRRTDVPLLVVQGRAGSDWLAETGLTPQERDQIRVLPAAADLRQVYAQTKALLMPSLWNEVLGRVAIEATINGIPVLASRRGGLPEALAGSGFLLDLPDHIAPATRQIPSADDVAPWVITVERLWNGRAIYNAAQQECHLAARAWGSESLVDDFAAFLTALSEVTPKQPEES